MNTAFKSLFVPGSLTFFNSETISRSHDLYPSMLNVEPTNDCNLRCVMCARAKANIPPTYMKFTLFQRIMDEARDYGGVRWLALHKDGESLLHPDFSDMIAYVKKTKAADFTHCNTNALLLTEEKAIALIEAGLDSLTLSIDAATPETYLAVKGGEGLSAVRRNAETLLEARTRLGAQNPVVRAKIIDMPITRPEIDAFKKQWTGLADEIQVQAMHNHAGGIGQDATGPRHPCSLLWYSVAVNSDGTVSTCCLDYSRKSILGTLETQNLADIFQGPEMRRYRTSHRKNRYEALMPCGYCNAWKAGVNISCVGETATTD